jgi:hypothetical protein
MISRVAEVVKKARRLMRGMWGYWPRLVSDLLAFVSAFGSIFVIGPER